MSTKAIKAIQMVYANTTKHDWPDDIWEAICQAIAEAEKHEVSQEPVAHFGSAYVNENGVHVTTVLGPVAIPQDAKLYTHPQPKREPLTDEQIRELFNEHSGYGRSNFLAFARAIEAAHGIKK